MAKPKVKQKIHHLFVLGSKSPQKFLALCLAAEQLPLLNPETLIECIDAASGVNPQPFGREETIRGARNRAMAAAVYHPGRIAIGIENGLFEVEDGFSDVGIVVVKMADLEVVAETEGVIFPRPVVKEAMRRGFDQVTAGQILAEIHNGECDPQDPHRFLTNGRKPRIKILSATIYAAIIETLRLAKRPAFSFPLPRA